MECSTCNFDRLDELEEQGQLALDGKRSWNSLSEEFGLTRQSIKNHMEKHWTPAPTATDEALAPFDASIAQTIEELMGQMAIAPPELKPMYAVAIQNLRGLHETKASQQNLISALKAITEVTGMKMEQQLMLQFAQARFGLAKPAPVAALPEPDLIEVESEEVLA